MGFVCFAIHYIARAPRSIAVECGGVGDDDGRLGRVDSATLRLCHIRGKQGILYHELGVQEPECTALVGRPMQKLGRFDECVGAFQVEVSSLRCRKGGRAVRLSSKLLRGCICSMCDLPVTGRLNWGVFVTGLRYVFRIHIRE